MHNVYLLHLSFVVLQVLRRGVGVNLNLIPIHLRYNLALLVEGIVDIVGLFGIDGAHIKAILYIQEHLFRGQPSVVVQQLRRFDNFLVEAGQHNLVTSKQFAGPIDLVRNIDDLRCHVHLEVAVELGENRFDYLLILLKLALFEGQRAAEAQFLLLRGAQLALVD